MEKEIHILVLPYPAVGHINPMLQFSKRLASKGPKVTLVMTGTMSTGYKSMQAQARSVAIEPISDGSDEAKSLGNWDHDLFKAMVSESLAKLIEKLGKSSKYPPKCLVYDSVMPWAIDVARHYGLTGAAFFTQSCAVKAIYYHAHVGSILRMPLEGPTVSLPSLPLLGIDDLPSFLCDTDSYPAFLTLVLNQFSNIQEANWILCNTFDMLEDEIMTWMASQWPVKTIGPAIPSVYLDKRLEDDKEYGLNLFKPDADACMKWLDTKETGSVIYASFGSLVALGEEQMEEVAWGLKNSNCYFLWVVRESEEKKLPSNFLQETAEKGLVVSWCPQLEVLAHEAAGCFMTHCGWNSTLEALSLGVPLVAMPQWTDQTTNAKFIVDVWKVGVRIKLDEKGIATKEEIEMCIKEVMEGERGKEMKKNSMRWKELAKEAVDEGGSSDKNIVEFVAKLAHS
ncbi:hypothetical protein I3843_01G192500 [Carya illinoinensis]|uniref:Glycosyltransferase n=2 Tax=Carya illinoinensis TaxID=32201 RepID=A0A922G131_CARIL|nr:mogroside IE synthase-like isoform X2 [Carya illinoinensis]KAG6732904.1 hypothetical protein I3842_01G199900 [Carya illinoinensis]KAG7997070.1 hypothetical protein I3843_01G192500 [Carya illinoinensis]